MVSIRQQSQSIDSQVTRLKNYLPELGHNDRQFAESLIGTWRTKHRLSQPQQLWVDKLIDRAIESNERKALAAIMPVQTLMQSVGPLVARFKNAQSKGVQSPKIRTALDNGSKLVLAMPKESQFVYVRVNDSYAGKISADGVVSPYPITKPFTDEMLQRIEAIAANPSAAGKIHGQKHGNCMFCSRDLTTTDSVHYGYGPICAEKWGLEWGSARERQAEEREAKFEEGAQQAFDSLLGNFKCE